MLSNALERFRKRWLTEYLLSLRKKHYNKCAEDLTHHLRVGQLVMVRHDNVHRIEWPLGVITATFPDEKGVIRTAEVEECGRRTLRPVTFLVPLELDCRHENDDIRQSRSDDDERGNDNDDDDDDVYRADGINDDATSTVDNLNEAVEQMSSNSTAGTKGESLLHNASFYESTDHRASGSSRASGLANGTTPWCTNSTTSPSTTSPYLLPTVQIQTPMGEERNTGMGEATTSQRQPRRAALKQRELLKRLMEDEQL